MAEIRDYLIIMGIGVFALGTLSSKTKWINQRQNKTNQKSVYQCQNN
jgi:hypothetical protein